MHVHLAFFGCWDDSRPPDAADVHGTRTAAAAAACCVLSTRYECVVVPSAVAPGSRLTVSTTKEMIGSAARLTTTKA